MMNSLLAILASFFLDMLFIIKPRLYVYLPPLPFFKILMIFLRVLLVVDHVLLFVTRVACYFQIHSTNAGVNALLCVVKASFKSFVVFTLRSVASVDSTVVVIHSTNALPITCLLLSVMFVLGLIFMRPPSIMKGFFLMIASATSIVVRAL